MNYTTIAARITPPDADALRPQVSRALESHTELLSRERFPWLWQQTDRLRAARPTDRPAAAPARARFMGCLNLLLGLVLLPAGLTRQGGSAFVLAAALVGIGAGIGGLWRSFRPRRSAYDRAADTLLEYTAGHPGFVRFTPAGMTLSDAPGSAEEFVPCGALEQILETRDLLLLVWEGRILTLQKKDVDGDPDTLLELLTRSAPAATHIRADEPRAT